MSYYVFMRSLFILNIDTKTQYRIVYGFTFPRGDTHSKGVHNTTTKVQRNLIYMYMYVRLITVLILRHFSLWKNIQQSQHFFTML